MDLSPRLLDFLEHEMKQIMEDSHRDLEDREHASAVLGRIEGEIEYEKEQQLKEDAEASELFA